MSERKLIKIKAIHLYTAFNEDVQECYTVMKMLRESEIDFTFLNFGDQKDHYQQTLNALSTWPLGQDSHKKECTKFPILVWDECFNDWTIYRRIAHGIEEIKNCDVFSKKELI